MTSDGPNGTPNDLLVAGPDAWPNDEHRALEVLAAGPRFSFSKHMLWYTDKIGMTVRALRYLEATATAADPWILAPRFETQEQY